ncbi:hypothetical protein PQR21_06700 [Paraburkholderia nemoris]|uniref:hypothetical protein n=1 Tax=Paraburkholderia nemoris TaxID=2793076 RepID=UPI0038B7DE3D
MRTRNAVVFVLISCVFGAQLAHAQALPVASFAINRAEAAIITRVAIARGFAANDPRIAATLTGMSQASTALNVASTGASVALGFAGAPVWLTVAAGLGILAAGSYLYANSGAVSFSRSSDGRVITVQQPLPVSAGAGYAPMSGSGTDTLSLLMNDAAGQGIPVFHTSSCLSTSPCAAFPAEPTSGNKNFYMATGGYSIIAATLSQAQQAEQVMATPHPPTANVQGVSVSLFFTPNADGTAYTLQETVTKGICTVFGGSDGQTCVSGQYNFNTYSYPKAGVQAYWSVGPGVMPVGGTDLSQIYPQLSQAALNTPLDPSTLMQMTNQTWQQAASQAGYQGLPYSVTNPIQYSDVQSWAQANPSAVPDVGSLFEPAANPGASVVISPTVSPTGSGDPATSPSAGTGNDVNVVNTPNVNVTNKVSVDLGPDPGVGTPTMEATPTISMILTPLLSMLPDLKHWSMPAHSATCPEPTFSVLGQTYTLSAQCDLAESHRQAIYTAFAAMFTLAALFVVLRA